MGIYRNGYAEYQWSAGHVWSGVVDTVGVGFRPEREIVSSGMQRFLYSCPACVRGITISAKRGPRSV